MVQKWVRPKKRRHSGLCDYYTVLGGKYSKYRVTTNGRKGPWTVEILSYEPIIAKCKTKKLLNKIKRRFLKNIKKKV